MNDSGYQQREFHYEEFSITKAGVAAEGKQIALNDIAGVRWGSGRIPTERGRVFRYEMAFQSKSGFEIGIREQEVYPDGYNTWEIMFNDMVDITRAIVVSKIVDTYVSKLRKDAEFRLGECLLTREGASSLTRGFSSFRRTSRIAWHDMGAHRAGDFVMVYDLRNPANPIVISMLNEYNAAILPDLVDYISQIVWD